MAKRPPAKKKALREERLKRKEEFRIAYLSRPLVVKPSDDQELLKGLNRRQRRNLQFNRPLDS